MLPTVVSVNTNDAHVDFKFHIAAEMHPDTTIEHIDRCMQLLASALTRAQVPVSSRPLFSWRDTSVWLEISVRASDEDIAATQMRIETAIAKVVIPTLRLHGTIVSAPEKSAVTARLKELGLTGREIEAAYFLSTGLTNKAIAAAMFLTVSGVEWHVTSILRKTGMSNRRQLSEWMNAVSDTHEA